MRRYLVSWYSLFVMCTSLHHVAGVGKDGVHVSIPPMCEATSATQRHGLNTLVMGTIESQAIVDDILSFLSSNITLEDKYYNMSGIYLMSDPVPHTGYISNIRVFGYLGDADLQTFVTADKTAIENGDTSGINFTALPHVYGVVYRPILSEGIYTLHHGPKRIAHDAAPGSISADSSFTWSVDRGDRVGVIIPDMCDDDMMFCPSHVNLRVRDDECQSALYFNNPSSDLQDLHDIEMDAFKEVLVKLNMDVTIETMSNVPVIAVSVCLAFVTLILCVLVSVLICCIVIPRIKRRKKKSVRFTESTNGILQNENRNRVFSTTYEDMSLKIAPSESQPLPGDGDGDGEEGEDDSDYEEEAYFEPAFIEEDLIFQLTTKLAVPEIPRENLSIYEVIGSGAYGTVRKGMWFQRSTEDNQMMAEEVAVKTMEGEASEEDRVKFLQEAAIMGQFNHANIITLRGIVSDEPMMIVVDLMRGGDLKRYMLNIRKRLSSFSHMELGSTLLSYSRQIAVGMDYLISKSFIHRDIAARNVLMSEDGTICKIADFGLSCDLQNESFYVSHGGKVPLKSTAPEAITHRKYSPASDVWSYGYVLYEIWSLGEKLFQGLSGQEAMKKVMGGYRLPPPAGCPRTLYHLMIQCWHPQSEERPFIGDIVQQLQQSEFNILKWKQKDKAKYCREVRTIGSPLELGMQLYTELQDVYIIDVNTTTES